MVDNALRLFHSPCHAMSTNHIRFDVERLVEDITLRGWMTNELARRAGVSDMTAYRFINGTSRTAKTAAKLAAALGYSVRRYVIRRGKAA